MDCIITIKGNKGKQGWTTNTKTGPIRYFIKDLEAYYRGVYEHCLKCQICNPNEILLAFLKNRDERHKGLTSDLIIKMAFKYERAIKGVKREIVNDYVSRSATIEILVNRSNRFTRDELLAAFKRSQSLDVLKATNLQNFESKKLKHLNTIKGIKFVLKEMGKIPDDDYKFDQLVGVAEVMGA